MSYTAQMVDVLIATFLAVAWLLVVVSAGIFTTAVIQAIVKKVRG